MKNTNLAIQRPAQRERLLVRDLQRAHAGEGAAALAYRGHAWSLRHEPATAAMIRRLETDERAHRTQIAQWLTLLDARPARARECVMHIIGAVVAASCVVLGRFLPMALAGLIERSNVGEYQRLHASIAGTRLNDIGNHLQRMAECEREHESALYAEARRHRRAWTCFAWITGWREPAPTSPTRTTVSDGDDHPALSGLA